MKYRSYLKSPIFFILLLSLVVLGYIGLNKLDKSSEEKVTLTNSQIEKIKLNLKIISSSPAYSSNPGDYINAHKKEYDEIIAMGEPAVNYFISEFKNGNLHGLDEWITAWICNEILGDRNPVKIWAEDNKNGWSSGSEWFEKYTEVKR